MQRTCSAMSNCDAFEFGEYTAGQDTKLGTVNLKAAQIEAAAVGLITT